MIYKVFYQETKKEVPVRERTMSLYVEATSEREVRYKLKDRDLNIEFIQTVEDDFLSFEQKSEHFELENV
ncbi:DNA-dependent RNA polymerase subunit epsilon [Pseudalkalibacillus hwajinpoensis]|uniref:DNA-dependent RNA polymerase subunit epsilon n=1 Tax=Guptibacillus hwajinpoensis TaxID=208199 RepID=UPI001CD1D700|nr:DNA-directed RNA polymerase subunit epsilon [Pseudalkalibacillus hwajinpoensis]MCA0990054.1 DNA-dependent RNA polymerase auxiliary subunit epsilon family protein [Pseudalkalibacillus hwajinpoensis]